jgi:serralysin
VLARTNFALEAGQSIEKLYADVMSGTDALNLTGNEQQQAIIGTQGNNRLDGGDGADILQGLGGGDAFVFD